MAVESSMLALLKTFVPIRGELCLVYWDSRIAYVLEIKKALENPLVCSMAMGRKHICQMTEVGPLIHRDQASVQ